jgi:hypothetical protein
MRLGEAQPGRRPDRLAGAEEEEACWGRPGRRRPSRGREVPAQPGSAAGAVPDGGPSGEGVPARLARTAMPAQLPYMPAWARLIRPRSIYSGLTSNMPAWALLPPAQLTYMPAWVAVKCFLISCIYNSTYITYVRHSIRGTLVYPGLYPRH